MKRGRILVCVAWASVAVAAAVSLACEGNIEGPLEYSGTGDSSPPPVTTGGSTSSTGGASVVASGGSSGTPSAAGGSVAAAGSGVVGGSAGSGGSGGEANPCGTGQLLCGSTCVNPLTDAAYCGSCTTPCQAGQVCTNGQCGCGSGLSPCGASCLDLTSDAANCGSCGMPCTGAEVCALSGCTLGCPDQLTQCGQSCVDLLTSVLHCGDCTKACADGLVCEGGGCVCPGDLSPCGANCVDHQTDNGNCGTCGTVCSGGRECTTGSCQCPSGTWCSNQCRDFQTDPQNCGSCGNACASASCTAGKCNPVQASDELIGWATQGGTTTGGGTGTPVEVDTASELINAAKSSTTQVIRITGSLTIPALVVASNKTLIGANASATIVGGVEINGKSNIIIKNLKINGKTSTVDGDGMRITNSHHIWIDHCEIWDSKDGNLDISEASNYITVSWTKFWYSSSPGDEAHRYSNLIGGGDGATGDAGKLKVTWHHNWWAARVYERAPRVRFGEVHVFNNYYSSSGNNYSIRAGYQSRIRVENNYFKGVKNPHEVNEDSGTGQITASGNTYDGTSGSKTSNATVFTPPYSYTLDSASSIPAAVQAGAGPH